MAKKPISRGIFFFYLYHSWIVHWSYNDTKECMNLNDLNHFQTEGFCFLDAGIIDSYDLRRYMVDIQKSSHIQGKGKFKLRSNNGWNE